jgi:uncharacterized protein
MREPIDPEGIDFRRVSPRLIRLRLVVQGTFGLICVGVCALPLILRQTGVWQGVSLWLAALPAVVVLLAVVWGLALIPRQVRAIGYAERNDDLLIRRGLFFQRVLVVPYGRMQYVDVSVGPLERAYGLASIKLHTASAGTNAVLEGLPAEEATRLREQLSARGEAKLAGL